MAVEHIKPDLAAILARLDLGSSVAEQDSLLEKARVETSAFSDLFLDKIDLIPGTKGSGKSALYRIFVDFLADSLLRSNKVVVAHGVEQHGDSVFQVYNEQFESLDEDDFVSFWCVYLVSLANEHFVKSEKYARFLAGCASQVQVFQRECARCGIPNMKSRRSLRDVLGWVLAVLKVLKPSLQYRPPGEAGEFELGLFGGTTSAAHRTKEEAPGMPLPRYVTEVKAGLEAVLERAGLSLWLMIDRLDEIFPRRSDLETRALRALLRTMRVFESDSIRVKVFLRDDILDQVVNGGQGFVALTHVTARASDTLRWSQSQILAMIVKRLFAHAELRNYLGVEEQRLDASPNYREQAFYKVFPPKVHAGENQSPTLRWIYNHTLDGRNVVTPRDVLELVTRAKQWQQDDFRSNPSGYSEWVIGPAAIRYGLAELSKRKRTTLLEAEFPHLWPEIKKFVGKKTEYSEVAMRRILGNKWHAIAEDLVSIGVFGKTTRRGKPASYRVPFLYREGLELTQGRME